MKVLVLIPTSIEFTAVSSQIPGNSLYMRDRFGQQLRSVLLPGLELHLYICGVGKKRAVSRTTQLLQTGRFHRLICAGCCGSLEPRAVRGGILVPDQIINTHGIPVPVQIPENLKAAGQGCSMISVSKPADLRDKMQLHRQFPIAAGVDMESYWIAKTAEKFSIPVTVIRGIVDRFDDEVPVFNHLPFPLSVWNEYVKKKYLSAVDGVCKKVGQQLFSLLSSI